MKTEICATLFRTKYEDDIEGNFSFFYKSYNSRFTSQINKSTVLKRVLTAEQ